MWQDTFLTPPSNISYDLNIFGSHSFLILFTTIAITAYKIWTARRNSNKTHLYWDISNSRQNVIIKIDSLMHRMELCQGSQSFYLSHQNSMGINSKTDHRMANYQYWAQIHSPANRISFKVRLNWLQAIQLHHLSANQYQTLIFYQQPKVHWKVIPLEDSTWQSISSSQPAQHIDDKSQLLLHPLQPSPALSMQQLHQQQQQLQQPQQN